MKSKGIKDITSFYTYVLAYPESMGGAIFYVGKGTGSRIEEHERQAKSGYESEKCSIIRLIWANGEEVVKRKVLEASVERDAFIHEWGLINFVYGREHLANLSDGQGVSLPREMTRQVTLRLPKEIVDAIDTITLDSRPGYISRLVRLNADMIGQLVRRKISLLRFPSAREVYRQPFIVHLTIDVIDMLDAVRFYNRTDVIETLLCGQYATNNITEWIIAAIQEKRQREQANKPEGENSVTSETR